MPTDCTRIWLIRHAVVEENSRAFLYGRMDVPICLESRGGQTRAYQSLAARLPSPAVWMVSPLRRTRETALAIAAAGYDLPALTVEPDLTEQDLGDWQGLVHAALPPLLAEPAHAFWPLGGTETPPRGESMSQVIDRVGAALERIADTNPCRDVVAVSHGGAIRAALAHATGAGPDAVLHFAVQNLSVTILERFAHGWRVCAVNETGPWLEA